MPWYTPWTWARERDVREKTQEIDTLRSQYLSLEHNLGAVGAYNDTGRRIMGEMNGIRTRVSELRTSLGEYAPPDPIEAMLEVRRRSREAFERREKNKSRGSGDSPIERRTQEIAGQRYSAAEVMGGRDTDYEQAVREADDRAAMENMNY